MSFPVHSARARSFDAAVAAERSVAQSGAVEAGGGESDQSVLAARAPHQVDPRPLHGASEAAASVATRRLAKQTPQVVAPAGLPGARSDDSATSPAVPVLGPAEVVTAEDLQVLAPLAWRYASQFTGEGVETEARDRFMREMAAPLLLYLRQDVGAPLTPAHVEDLAQGPDIHDLLNAFTPEANRLVDLGFSREEIVQFCDIAGDLGRRCRLAEAMHRGHHGLSRDDLVAWVKAWESAGITADEGEALGANPAISPAIATVMKAEFGDQLQHELGALAALPPAEQTDALRVFAPEAHALRSRGFSLADLDRFLSVGGSTAAQAHRFLELGFTPTQAVDLRSEVGGPDQVLTRFSKAGIPASHVRVAVRILNDLAVRFARASQEFNLIAAIDGPGLGAFRCLIAGGAGPDWITDSRLDLAQRMVGHGVGQEHLLAYVRTWEQANLHAERTGRLFAEQMQWTAEAFGPEADALVARGFERHVLLATRANGVELSMVRDFVDALERGGVTRDVMDRTVRACAAAKLTPAQCEKLARFPEFELMAAPAFALWVREQRHDLNIVLDELAVADADDRRALFQPYSKAFFPLRERGGSTGLCAALLEHARGHGGALGSLESLTEALCGFDDFPEEHVPLGIRCLEAQYQSAVRSGRPFEVEAALARAGLLPGLLDNGMAAEALPTLLAEWCGVGIGADELHLLLQIPAFQPEMAVSLKIDKGAELAAYARDLGGHAGDPEVALRPYSARLRAAGIDVALATEVLPRFGSVDALFARFAAAGIGERYMGVALRQMRDPFAAASLPDMHALRALIAAGSKPEHAERRLVELRAAGLEPAEIEALFAPRGAATGADEAAGTAGTPGDCEARPYLELGLLIPELLALRERVAAAAPFHRHLADFGYGADRLPWLVNEYRRLGITLRNETLPRVRRVVGVAATRGAGAFNQVSSSTYEWDDGEVRETVFKPQRAPDPTRTAAVDTSSAGRGIGIDPYNPRLAERNLLSSALMAYVQELAPGADPVPEVYPKSALGEAGSPATLGLIMEFADGVRADAAAPELFASGEFDRQASVLQLLDHILGQADRHGGNYILTFKDGALRLVAVDNDASAGYNHDPDELADRQTRFNDPGFRGVRLPRVVDRVMADVIGRMTPDRLRALFEQYLPGDEAAADAAVARLRALQAHLRSPNPAVIQVIDVAAWGTAAVRARLDPATSYAGRDRQRSERRAPAATAAPA